jgi:DNA polymerase elongation subunit (family B)
MELVQSTAVSTLCTRASFCDVQSNTEDIWFFPSSVSDGDNYTIRPPRYMLNLFGTLENGEKARVILTDVPLYFDYDVSVHDVHEWRMSRTNMLEHSTDLANIERNGMNRVRAILTEIGMANAADRMEVIWQYPMHGFTLDAHMYVRIYFSLSVTRSRVIHALRDVSEYNGNLTHDDMGYGSTYFNAVAREFKFATAGWNTLHNYQRSVIQIGDRAGTIHVFRMSVRDIRALSNDDATIDSRRVLYDRTLIESWDIETEFNSPTGEIPRAGDNYTIATISLVYSYMYLERPLICYVLTLYATDAPRAADFEQVCDHVVFIKCCDERDMLITRARIAQRMQPDIRIAFNGSNFDWPLFNDKVARLGIDREILTLMDWDVTPRTEYTRRFTQQRVKINADTNHELAQVSIMAGTLDLDIMPAMHRIYKKEEVRFAESLNVYLRKANLPPKNDIYFRVMMQMFARARALCATTSSRECHCATDRCATCSARIRELDYEVVNANDPMREWKYNDGVMRDARLNLCCACGARVINLADIARINTYCAIDSIRPLQLMHKLGVLNDARELSNVTYTSLNDSFMRADGMRVVNFVGSIACVMGLAIPARAPDRPNVSFPGAHVFTPILGRKTVPVTALDFNSLYPSLIRAYNISPDMIVTSRETANMLRERGYELHHIEPIDYIEIYTNVVTGKNENRPRTMEGWTVRHNGVLELPQKEVFTHRWDAANVDHVGRAALEREHMGIFGIALSRLLGDRGAVKRQMSAIAKAIAVSVARIDGITVPELDMAALIDQLRAVMSAEQWAAVRDDIMSQYLKYNMLNSKQLALKVLANTFYGQMGSNRSVCYTLLGAAGVTAAGRYNILRVAQLLRERGYTIVYGDTDSVYVSAPDSLYTAINARYHNEANAMSLEEYWGLQVTAARADINALSIEVSAFLRADNGTQFLNMAYEEVCMPSVFFGKKKYIARPHLAGVTFGARPMVRGLETVKQGRAPILRKLGDRIITQLLGVEESVNVVSLVTNIIDEFYASRDAGQLDIAQFVRFASYKPGRKNQMVLRFVERMTDAYRAKLREGGDALASPYRPPEAGDKFAFVIVERDESISIDGHRMILKVGDKMEYVAVAAANGMQIDIAHYMAGSLILLFARFIGYDGRFSPENDPTANVDANGDYTAYDAWRQNAASRYLGQYIARYSGEEERRAHATIQARTQRTTASAFCGILVSNAARDGVSIDMRIARVFVDDRIAKTCARVNRAPYDNDVIDDMCVYICDIANERSAADIMDENERIETYAVGLESIFNPSQLAIRYSRAGFDAIMTSLDMRANNVRANIKRLVTEFITSYRIMRIADLVISTADNAIENDTRAKSSIIARINEKLSLNVIFMQLLDKLGRLMKQCATFSENKRCESTMHAKYAQIA